MTPRILTIAILVAALTGCATTQPGPTAAQLHAELERCKAEARLGWHTDVNLCFVQARRELVP
jgi:hypothetical protein